VHTSVNSPVRFGVFELDVRAGELRRSGRRVALQPQPLEILRALMERPGEVVTREELRRRLWSNGAYVDFDRSLNKAIVKLRDALGDDADTPRYIETLPRRGYRFIPLPNVHAHVDAAPEGQSALTANMPQPEGPASPQISPVPRVQSAGTRHSWRWATLGLTLLTLAAWIIWFRVEGPSYSGSPANVAPAAAVAFAPPPHSIAVLPFVNMSGDKEQDYFSDGVSEELLNSLSRIKELQVAARTSSFYFKGEHADLSTIAHKLNVASVLEGSVRRSGHTVRITAQLNNALTGFHLWSQTYDRDLSDVLQLQTEIANAVASALKVTLLGDVAAKIEVGGTRNPAAFDAYLRGSNAFLTVHNLGEGQAAVAAYTEAIRLDPRYAQAFAARSLARYGIAMFATTVPVIRESLEAQQADAREALRLAPDLVEGHLALAVYYADSLNFAPAGEEIEHALALAPGDAHVLRLYGRYAGVMGRFDAGIAALHRAVVLDPLNPVQHRSLGFGLAIARRHSEAIEAFEHALALDPDSPQANAGRGLSYYALGDFHRAQTSCERTPEFFLNQVCLASTYEKLGHHAEAEATLAKLKASWGDTAAYPCAEIYAQWGDQAKALQWLDTAMRLHDPILGNLKTDYFLDPLRREPRFQAIERELRFTN
jgi:TolB-like protein/DNA-binding winged helix-turn-helix (wHTH) protein/lipoprotein NlpI